MRIFKKWPVRIILFAVGFCLLHSLMVFLFLDTDMISLLTMYDYNRTENIDIAFIGNSTCYRNINNSIIDTSLGLDSFDLAITTVRPYGGYALMKELFRNHTPGTVVYVYDCGVEGVLAESRIWPRLPGIGNKVSWALNASRQDGQYLDRFFPWRTYHPNSLANFYSNLRGKLNQEELCVEKNLKLKNQVPFIKGMDFMLHIKVWKKAE